MHKFYCVLHLYIKTCKYCNILQMLHGLILHLLLKEQAANSLLGCLVFGMKKLLLNYVTAYCFFCVCAVRYTASAHGQKSLSPLQYKHKYCMIDILAHANWLWIRKLTLKEALCCSVLLLLWLCPCHTPHFTVNVFLQPGWRIFILDPH